MNSLIKESFKFIQRFKIESRNIITMNLMNKTFSFSYQLLNKPDIVKELTSKIVYNGGFASHSNWESHYMICIDENDKRDIRKHITYLINIITIEQLKNWVSSKKK